MGERDSENDTGDGELALDIGASKDDTPIGPTGIGATTSRPEETAAGSVETETGWLAGRIPSLLAGRDIGATFLLAFLGIVVVAQIPLLGAVPFVSVLGIVLGTFVHGTLATESRYVEAAVGGALAGGTVVLLRTYFLALVSITGSGLLTASILLGALAGAGGHYLGRDLREGMTRELE